MVTVLVLVLCLIHVNAIHGKSITFNRRSMNTETSSRDDYREPQMSYGKVQGFEKHFETQIGFRKQMDLAARIISTSNIKNEEVLTTPLDEMLDPSDQLRQRQRRRRRRTTTEAQPLTTTPYTVKYLDTEPSTKKKLWTTSLDPLQMMLTKQLPFFDPAPDQVGQLDKGIMNPVTQPLWIFEEYDDTSSKSEIVREEYRTCESQMLRCTGETDYNQPVCVIDLTMDDSVPEMVRNKGFHSQCEVTYRNCLKRYEITGKYYADSYQEDYLEFLHYGWCDNCELYPDRNCTGEPPGTIATITPF